MSSLRFERVASGPVLVDDDSTRVVVRRHPHRMTVGGSPLTILRQEVRQLLLHADMAGHRESRRVGPGRERAGYRRALTEVMKLIDELE